MDCILKNLAYIFHILTRYLEAQAKNVLLVTFPAKTQAMSFCYFSRDVSHGSSH